VNYSPLHPKFKSGNKLKGTTWYYQLTISLQTPSITVLINNNNYLQQINQNVSCIWSKKV